MSVFSGIRLFRRAMILVRKYPFRKRLGILRDFLSLHRIKGLTIEEYYDFEFEKQDEEFRNSFLGKNEQRHYLDYLNPIKYYSLSRNKYLAHKVLENAGVRMPALFCYYQPEACYSASEECASNLDGVIHLLKENGVQACVIKTTESSHGDNVWVINSIEYKNNDATMLRYDGTEILLSSILGQEALVFESLVRQTEQLSSFNESSVNTVRFMTTLYPDGSAKVIAAFFKIGRAGKCVDNAGNGGNVDTSVDVKTGEIKYAIQFDGWRNIKEIDRHPDSGANLNGVRIEGWESIKEEVKRFQQAFPFCKAAGWDIAITDNGPVVIEVNDFWDRTGQFFIRRGWRNEIRDCYLAWQKTGKKYIMVRRSNTLEQGHLNRIAAHE